MGLPDLMLIGAAGIIAALLLGFALGQHEENQYQEEIDEFERGN